MPMFIINKGEKPGCEFFKELNELGPSGPSCNVCKGNEPYSCDRSQREGLCHKGGAQ